MYGIAGYLSYTFRWIKIALKIIKADSDSRRIADASIYKRCQVNWRTNILLSSLATY